MRVSVISFISWKQDLTGDYQLDEPTNIVDFVQSLQLSWDQDALVVVNNSIIDQDYVLQDGDQVHLLLPILGG